MHIEITILNTFSSSESMQHRKSGMEPILVHGFGCCLLVVVFIVFLSLFLSFLFEKWTGWNNNFYWSAHSHITCVCGIYRVLFSYVEACMYLVSHYLALAISLMHIMMPTVWFATWFFQLRFHLFSFCILSPWFPTQPLASFYSVCRFCALFSSNLLIFSLNELFV